MRKKRWNIIPYSPERVNALRAELKVNEKLCRILVQRGYTDYENCHRFFRPSLNMLYDPWLMKDMDKAVERIEKAFINREKILVFGDYDVDGTTAVATVYSFLQKIYISSQLDYYIPHRYKEGYGVSRAGIEYAAENGFTLIISLDCGIKSVDLIKYAASLGIDFIVCDHHLPGKELPPAVAILNPKQADCNYPFKDLCGCGVGFKLITALARKNNIAAEEVNEYIDLVAIAIAADIVPIVDENRVLAHFGLQKINANPCKGVQALLKLSVQMMPLSISSLVFIIAPRVNAAGRMDDARKAVQLFIERDENLALQFAQLLHIDNIERKDADKTITEEALSLLTNDPGAGNRKSTVVYQEHWHKGVVGIVASRLIDTFYKPTIVLTKSGEFATGSARSVPGFNLYEAIYECREYLQTYGGHFAAAGLTLKEENLQAFTQKFEEVVSASIGEELLTPTINIDTEIELAEITHNFYNIIKQMEPFGPENMRPVFLARNLRDNGYSRILKEKHIRFVLTDGKATVSGIGFNMAEEFEALRNPVDVVFTLDENDWNGVKSLQIKVLDFLPAAS